MISQSRNPDRRFIPRPLVAGFVGLLFLVGAGCAATPPERGEEGKAVRDSVETARDLYSPVEFVREIYQEWSGPAR